jgi:hypothetical protein
MYRTYVLNVGFNDKDKKVQLLSTEKCRAIVTELTLAAFPCGCTLTATQGAYKMEDGANVFENGIQVDVVSDCNIQVVYNLIEKIKVALNQESIMLRIAEYSVNFI